jgi:hypothetical protein
MPDETTVAAEEPKLRLLNPREVRRDSEIEVDLGDGTMVKARKMDMTLLVFEGQISMTMLTAVQKMVELPDASPVERVEALGGEGRSMVDLLRKHASIVTIQPRITLEESADPNVIPASYLNLQQLMAIWNATAVTPRFGVSQASRFRVGPSADDAPPAPVGEDVSPTSEPVAGAGPAKEIESDGRVVEYVGR